MIDQLDHARNYMRLLGDWTQVFNMSLYMSLCYYICLYATIYVF
jgi:hypothetical protein